MQQECQFEPSFARCSECGAETDEHGTCEDYALCWRCLKVISDGLGFEAEARRDYGQNVLAAIEGHKYRPGHRVLHYDEGGGPVCHVRGGPHPVTDSRNETNCKKCVRVLASVNHVT